MSEPLKAMFDHYCQHPEKLDEDAFRDVNLDAEGVVDGMLTQAETYLKWARLSAIAEAQYEELEHHVKKVCWYEACSYARDSIAKTGDKPTEQRINEIATSSKDYQRHVLMLNKASAIAATFKRIEYAMLQRKDMLQSLNSRQRAELDLLPRDPEVVAQRKTEFDRLRTQVAEIISKSRGV